MAANLFEMFLWVALAVFTLLGIVKATEIIETKPAGWRKTTLWIVLIIAVFGGLFWLVKDAHCDNGGRATRDGYECY